MNTTKKAKPPEVGRRLARASFVSLSDASSVPHFTPFVKDFGTSLEHLARRTLALWLGRLANLLWHAYNRTMDATLAMLEVGP